MSDAPERAVRYLVHVGRQKTGTTALQRALASSEPQLAQNRILYPLTGRRKFAQHDLAAAIKDQGPMIASLRDEIAQSDAETVIVSSEALQGVAPADLSRVFPPQQSEVVIYIREQADYLLSAYAQRVQATDLCIPFEEYVRPRYAAVDYLTSLEKYEESFGCERLHVRVYDRSTLVGGSTLVDFLYTTGLNDLEVAPQDPHDVNPSLDFEALRLKLLLNGLGLVSRDDLRRALYARLRKALRGPGWSGAKLSMPARLQQEIRERFADDNRKVFARYVRNGQEQFPMRDLSPSEGPDGCRDLTTVFEIVDTWRSLDGAKLLAEILAPPA